jgi:hypothetical protein
MSAGPPGTLFSRRSWTSKSVVLADVTPFAVLWLRASIAAAVT